MHTQDPIIIEFLNDFRQQYSHIHYHNFFSDDQITQFLEKNIDRPYDLVLNLFSDYLLSNGCEATA